MIGIIFRISLSSIKIALFSFGGGAAVISLIHKEYIENNKFMPEEDFGKLVILANAMPGPTVLQLTTYISFYAGSYIGAVLNYLIILFLTPSLVILSLSFLKPYIPEEDLHHITLSVIPAVVGMLFAFILRMFKKDKSINYNWFIYYLILISVFVLLLLNVSIILIFVVLIIFLLIFKLR